MNTIQVAREFQAEGSAYPFTLEQADEANPEVLADRAAVGQWIIHDGTNAEAVDTPAQALRTYAEYMETFVDDVPELQAEIDAARADADTVEAGR